MNTYKLGLQEQAATGGMTHCSIIDYTDLNGTADTTKTLDLASYTANQALIGRAFFVLETAFDGGSTSALKLDVGWNGGTTDDADALIDNIEVHADGTEVFVSGSSLPAIDSSSMDTTFGQQELDVLTSLKAWALAATALLQGYCPADSGVLQALFTATGANLTALTQGRIRIYFRLIDTTQLY